MENNEIKIENGDELVLATALNGHVRLLCLRAETLLNHFKDIHDMGPIAIQVAGKMAISALLLAKGMKSEKNRLTCTLKTDGELSHISVEAGPNGTLRGFVNNPLVPTYRSEDGKLDISKALGSGGILTVIKNLGLKEPYIGQVELQAGADLAQTFTLYLAKSEQINSFLSLGITLNNQGVLYAGGLLVQVMPDITEEELDYLEKRAYGGFPEISYLLGEGFTPAQIIDMFIGDPKLKYLETTKLAYQCSCNLDDMKRKLLLLGPKDLSDLACDVQGVQLECHYCASKYAVSQAEILDLIKDL